MWAILMEGDLIIMMKQKSEMIILIDDNLKCIKKLNIKNIIEAYSNNYLFPHNFIIFVPLYLKFLLSIMLDSFRKYNVNIQFKSIIYHSRKITFQKLTCLLQTWICVNFNQPCFQAQVYHEVISIYFEAIPPFFWVYLGTF